MTGVCIAHALQTPNEQPQSILFYQSDEHPERQLVPQPQQERAVAATSSSAVALDDDGWWATFGIRKSAAATSSTRAFLSDD
jgi:hypothetical protein